MTIPSEHGLARLTTEMALDHPTGVRHLSGSLECEDVTSEAYSNETFKRYLQVLELVTVNQSSSRRVSRSMYDRIRSLEMAIGSPHYDCSDMLERRSDFRHVLRMRESYRGPLTPCSQNDIENLLQLCSLSPAYRPFGVPGSLKVVSLIFRGSEINVSNLGEAEPILYDINCAPLENFISGSFVERSEVQDKISTVVAVGIDIAPLVAKYLDRAIGLTLMTIGGVLQTICLTATHLGLASLILSGARELKVWRLGNRSDVVIPSVVRIGRVR